MAEYDEAVNEARNEAAAMERTAFNASDFSGPEATLAIIERARRVLKPTIDPNSQVGAIKMAMLIVQAMEALGKNHVAYEWLERIVNQMLPKTADDVTPAPELPAEEAPAEE